MEFLTLSEIAKACGGTFRHNVAVTQVCIDTRKIQKGCLFVCIKGERLDAHQFAGEALKKGAAAVMIHTPVNIDGPYVLVEDTSKALLRLSEYYRSKFDIPLVALTGSVGKTTTKEFTYLVANAKYRTVKTLGNMNNEIGLPQMLFQIDSSTQAAVIEMGMNHFGEIHRLSLAARPTLGLITNIGVSHIENLGSREGILKAKLEIADGLLQDAPLLLNGDNDLLQTVQSMEHPIYLYGIHNGDFRATDISEEKGKTYFTMRYFGNSQDIMIPTIGIHNVYNAAAAFAVGWFLKVDPVDAANALSEYQPEGMRQRTVLKGGITSIEDCYNASPDSMEAALSALADTQGNKKIAVLADMLELGDYSKKAHYNVGKSAAEKGIDYLLCFGSDAAYYVEGAKSANLENAFLFSSKEKLSEKLLEIADKGDAVVFKGSRGMKLEDVIHCVYDRWEKYGQ